MQLIYRLDFLVPLFIGILVCASFVFIVLSCVDRYASGRGQLRNRLYVVFCLSILLASLLLFPSIFIWRQAYNAWLFTLPTLVYAAYRLTYVGMFETPNKSEPETGNL